jgi:PAS domain S-box-containing protein
MSISFVSKAKNLLTRAVAQIDKHPAARYVCAIGITAAAVYVRWLLKPFLGEHNPYIIVWVALVISCRYWGLGPAIASLATGATGVWFFLLPPILRFGKPELNHVLGIVVFVLVSGVIVLVIESYRRTAEKRVRIERMLSDSELRFRALVRANLIGVVSGENSRIIDANEAFLLLLGYTRHDLQIGAMDWEQMTPPEYAHQDSKAMQELISSGCCETFEKEYFRKDGSRVSVLIGAVSSNVSPLRWTCFVLDITSRKVAEQALRRSHAELEGCIKERTEELVKANTQLRQQAELLDLINDAVFVRSKDHRISYWNQGATRLYGWNREEAVGMQVDSLLKTEWPEPRPSIFERERAEVELKHTRRDGTKLNIASRWTTLRDNEQKLVGWLEINTDITAQKRADADRRRLTSAILHLQDVERRRIARELHDSLGQLITSVKINLGILTQTGFRQLEANSVIAECMKTLDQCLTETRTISHLLHPPLLEEAGFAAAAQWYLQGFGERSGINAAIEIPADLPRFPHDVELVLFRVL